MKYTLVSTALASTALIFVACDQSGAEDATAIVKSASTDTSSAATAFAGTVAVDNSNFGAVVLESDKLVLVDFGAEWCGPCKIVAPVVEQIAGDYTDRVVVATLDVDVAGDIAKGYGVQTLPTLMVFKDGKPVGTVPMNGLPTKADIARVLDKHL
jgi:thioredoxin 1